MQHFSTNIFVPIHKPFFKPFESKLNFLTTKTFCVSQMHPKNRPDDKKDIYPHGFHKCPFGARFEGWEVKLMNLKGWCYEHIARCPFDPGPSIFPGILRLNTV